jgi:N-acetylmuramoyl-L-alanine amidase
MSISNRALGALALAVGGIGAGLQLLRGKAGTAAQAAADPLPLRAAFPFGGIPNRDPLPEREIILPSVTQAPTFTDQRTGNAAPQVATVPQGMDRFRADAGEREVVARTAWGEARGEGRGGMAAVIHVIRNRADARFFGRSEPRFQSLAAFQFSVWNGDDANRRASLAVDTSNPHYRVALELYDQIILLRDDSAVPPQVRSATHYFVSNSPRPSWAAKIAHLGQYKAHAFYREDRA